MFIESLKDRLFIEDCCTTSGGVIEIRNSERSEDLKKVWIDCSSADNAALINLEAKRNNALCPLFRTPGDHLKVCDGIILIEKSNNYHAVFCEVKTSWNAIALRQIRNSHIFFEYARSLTKAWHGASDSNVTPWFAIITAGKAPVRKYGTSFKRTSIPTADKPSKNVADPKRIVLESGRAGLSSSNPLKLRDLAQI